MATKKKETAAKKPRSTKKTTTRKTTSSSKSNPDLVDDAGFAAVKGSLLWKYRAISAEWSEAQALLREKLLKEREEYTKDIYAPLRRIKSEISQMQIENASKTSELAAVTKEIAESFGLNDLKNCAIDSTTGRIYVLDDAGTAVQKAATPKTLKTHAKKNGTLSPPKPKNK